jgi:hypothetical protein
MRGNQVIIILIWTLILKVPFAGGADIKGGNPDSLLIITSFRLSKIGLSWADTLRSSIIKPEHDFIRTQYEEYPGYYYQQPTSIAPGDFIEPVEIDSSSIAFLESVVKPALSSKYYDDKIFDYVKDYYLKRFNRTEFYFNIISDSIPIRFSGWYGKFCHIIVFTYYDSKEGFIEKADEFFDLPELDIKKVEFDEAVPGCQECDFWYEYKDDKAKFKLVGYPVLRDEPGIEQVVLDLTVYADK